jgi:hypothetical protein
MREVLRRCRPPFVAVAMLLALADSFQARAQTAATDTKVLDKAAHVSLTSVINHGAELYNKYQDYAGCYHAYRAGLMAIRPFLAHRPDLQKTIDDGLAGAEEQPRVQVRAFALNKVLFNVRKQVAQRSSAAGKAVPDKGPNDKGVTAKKTAPPEEKTVQPPAQKMARLSGKLTYKGQPVSGGWYVTLVSTTDKHSFSTYVRADGTYAFKTPLPPGTYTIVIEEGPSDKNGAPARVAVPQRYQNPVTSGLSVRILAGPNSHDLDLQ